MPAPNIPNPPITPIGAPATWGPPPQNSSFSNRGGFSWPVSPENNGDTPGCFWDQPNSATIGAGAVLQIPPLDGWLITGAAVNSAVLQVQLPTGWTTIKSLNANDAFWYKSDYGNVRIQNGISGSTSILFVPVRNPN